MNRYGYFMMLYKILLLSLFYACLAACTTSENVANTALSGPNLGTQPATVTHETKDDSQSDVFAGLITQGVLERHPHLNGLAGHYLLAGGSFQYIVAGVLQGRKTGAGWQPLILKIFVLNQNRWQHLSDWQSLDVLYRPDHPLVKGVVDVEPALFQEDGVAGLSFRSGHPSVTTIPLILRLQGRGSRLGVYFDSQWVGSTVTVSTMAPSLLRLRVNGLWDDANPATNKGAKKNTSSGPLILNSTTHSIGWSLINFGPQTITSLPGEFEIRPQTSKRESSWGAYEMTFFGSDVAPTYGIKLHQTIRSCVDSMRRSKLRPLLTAIRSCEEETTGTNSDVPSERGVVLTSVGNSSNQTKVVPAEAASQNERGIIWPPESSGAPLFFVEVQEPDLDLKLRAYSSEQNMLVRWQNFLAANRDRKVFDGLVEYLGRESYDYFLELGCPGSGMIRDDLLGVLRRVKPHAIQIMGCRSPVDNERLMASVGEYVTATNQRILLTPARENSGPSTPQVRINSSIEDGQDASTLVQNLRSGHYSVDMGVGMDIQPIPNGSSFVIQWNSRGHEKVSELRILTNKGMWVRRELSMKEREARSVRISKPKLNAGGFFRIEMRGGFNDTITSSPVVLASSQLLAP